MKEIRIKVSDNVHSDIKDISKKSGVNITNLVRIELSEMINKHHEKFPLQANNQDSDLSKF